MRESKKSYSFFIGRFQPLHEGHIKLIQTVLDEGKNVCVGLKDTPLSETDPYTLSQRAEMFAERLPQVKVIVVPNIDEVCYGRKVGWGIREIRLDEETEKISATAIRESWQE